MGFLEFNMQILRAIAELRTPLLDTIIGLITRAGEETVFMAVAMIFLWCVDKNKGYYLLLVGFTGTVLNQILKLTFCIPRPWQLDPTFQIVESAREAATGYSFPSGHTQTGAGTFFALARQGRGKALRGACVLMGLLIGFSRLYLGVHTPLDVVVSLVLAAVLSQVLYQTVEEAKRRPGYMFRLWVFMLIPAALFVLFALHARAGVAADHPYLANYTSAIKTSVTILACTLGAIVTIAVDENVNRFETEAVWWVQIIKVVLGLGLVVAVKAGLKAPLYDLLGQGSFFADGIRYFLMVIVAGVLWPLTFHFFSHLGRK